MHLIYKRTILKAWLGFEMTADITSNVLKYNVLTASFEMFVYVHTIKGYDFATLDYHFILCVCYIRSYASL